jgi:hypothetical protein
MATHAEARLRYVPHFDVTTLNGQRVRYQDIWQRRNLVLLVVSPHTRTAAVQYASQLDTRRQEFEDAEATVVITSDAVPAVSPGRAVIADRWGEVLHIEGPPRDDISEFPSIDELISWVQFARLQCPECPP